MGCDEPPSAACLGSGGKTLEVDRMIYGSLSKTKSGGYTLMLSLMDVGTSSVTKTVNTELGADALSDATVQATAKDLVTQVLGPEAKPEPVVAPPPKVEEEPKPANNKLVWGKYDAPKWKKAGLGASAALTVVSLGVAIGTYMAIRPGGKLKKGFAGKAFAANDWLPVRITAAAFAIVGDFEDAVYCWRTQAGRWPDEAAGILLASGAGALGLRLGLPIVESGEVTERPELGLGEEADADFMQSGISLVWRTLVLCLLLLTLLGVASWAG